jgi:Ca-activated chloride channel family protein
VALVPGTSRTLRTAILWAASVVALAGWSTGAQSPAAAPTVHRDEPSAPAATFRSRVNLVSVAAVVRDKRGRILPSLSERDFEVLDEGQTRKVVFFRSGTDAPAGVAILVDGSGSMALSAARLAARDVADGLLATLTPGKDQAALLSFDTRLLTLHPFTDDFAPLRARLGKLDAYGSTSLYDAVAGSAAFVADYIQTRRALVVVTDGGDNASTHSAEQVAWIASTIDVPVYVFDVGDATDVRAATEPTRQAVLTDVARATGGDLFVVRTPQDAAAAIARLDDELRHQYVLAFEPTPGGGLRRVQLVTRNRELRVSARVWYRSQAD